MAPAPRALEPRTAGGTYLFAVLLGLVAWLPIPLGSNRPWSWGLMEGVALALLGAWWVRSLLRPAALPVPAGSTLAPVALLGAWLAYLLVQAAPWPESLGVPPGTAGAPYERLAAVVGGPVTAALSVDRGATLAAFLKASAYVSLFWLVLVLAAERRRLSRLCWVLVAVGAGESLVGLFVYLGGINGQIAPVGLYDRAGVAGTYVNRNHFAGMLEMTMAMALGLYLARSSRTEAPRGLRAWLRRTTRALLGPRGILAFCLLLMVSALLLSASRGGVGAFGLALLVVSLLSLSRSRSKYEIGRTLGIVIVLVALAGAWFGLGMLPAKVAQQGLSSNRGDLRDVTYGMIAKRWAFGSGAGTYRWVFPEHQDERFGRLSYEHAHNDYLEVLSEQGIVGFLLLYPALAWMLLRLVKAYRARRHPRLRGILFGSLLGCFSFLIHGAIDFNFQIPANAAYFMVLLAIGVVASRLDRARECAPAAAEPGIAPAPRCGSTAPAGEEPGTDIKAAARAGTSPRSVPPA